jgi:predicted nucleotidyltransferase
MDKTDALKIACDYAKEVKTRFDAKRVFLFGSYAKGTYSKDSDIDIAVVFLDYDNRMDKQVELMKLTRQFDTRIEPHPFRENEFIPSNPMIDEIVKYGQEIIF